jgi:hypothetical protein
MFQRDMRIQIEAALIDPELIVRKRHRRKRKLRKPHTKRDRDRDREYLLCDLLAPVRVIVVIPSITQAKEGGEREEEREGEREEEEREEREKEYGSDVPLTPQTGESDLAIVREREGIAHDTQA